MKHCPTIIAMQSTGTITKECKPITKREAEIMMLLNSGMKYHEAARKLHVSIETIRSHAHHAYKKLGVRNKTQAMLKIHFNNELNF